MELGIDQAAPDPSGLLKQMGFDRGAAMKQVVGPTLSKLLMPAYDLSISPEEAGKLPEVSEFGDLSQFAASVNDVISWRVADILREDPESYASLHTLISEERNLLHFGDVEPVLREGLRTGEVAPLTVAAHIYRLEKYGAAQRGQLEEVRQQPFDYTKFVDILERPSFDRMLHRLTKGPNGFLGTRSVRPTSIVSDDFFKFSLPNGDDMTYRDAYRLEDGKVVDLSGDYDIAAQAKRRKITEQYLETQPRRQDLQSSGCPVRHRLEDEDGEPQQSLITAGIKFLSAAMIASFDIGRGAIVGKQPTSPEELARRITLAQMISRGILSRA
jgi:hypothetical protein